MAESTSKGEPQSKQFSSAELGILDKKDISRFDSEAKKILEIEQLFDELIDHEDRLTHLIERFGDEMEKGDEEGKRTKKVSKLILPEYAQRDAQIILSAIRQQHADICIKSEETLRPYLDMSSQGSRDISRVAAHRALQNEGTLDNSDDVINPGLDNDGVYTPGNARLEGVFDSLEKVQALQEEAEALPWHSPLKKRSLNKTAQALQGSTLEGVEEKGKQREIERIEASNIIEKINIRDILKQNQNVKKRIEALESIAQAYLSGSNSLQLQAEDTLAKLRKNVINPSLNTHEAAVASLEELEKQANFKERKEEAQDKLQEGKRELKIRLLKIQKEVQGLGAVAEFFEGDTNSAESQEVREEVKQLFTQVKTFFDLADQKYDRAQQKIDSEDDLPQVQALVEMIITKDLRHYFAKDFYDKTDEILKKIERLAELLRAPKPALAYEDVKEVDYNNKEIERTKETHSDIVEIITDNGVYEVVTSLRDGEKSISKEDVEDLLSHQDQIPKELRDKYLMLPDLRHPDGPIGITCLHWKNGAWRQDWGWNKSNLGDTGRLVRRKSISVETSDNPTNKKKVEDREQKETYFVTVNYDMLMEEMIAAGQYDSYNRDINSENFPIKESGSLEVNLEFVHLGRNATTDEVEAELDKHGLRPATLAELLAFGAKYPDVQREFPVIASGSVWRGRGGGRDVPCLVRARVWSRSRSRLACLWVG